MPLCHPWSSSGWHSGPHSDPTGLTLKEVRRYLRSEPSTRGCALFWDIASRPQPEQTDEEAEIGRMALEVMSSFYASVTATCVIQQKAIPPRPPSYDGQLQLFGLPVALQEPQALQDSMGRFGTVLGVEILPSLVELAEGPGRNIAHVKQANAIVRFATHFEAEAAVTQLRQEKRGAALLYNDTPYEGKGGRGWCRRRALTHQVGRGGLSSQGPVYPSWQVWWSRVHRLLSLPTLPRPGQTVSYRSDFCARRQADQS